MTTPSFNIKMTDIQTEFGGTAPVNLSEYYRGGSLVSISQTKSPIDAEFISTSGVIRMGMFRNLSKFPAGMVEASASYKWVLTNTNSDGFGAARLAFVSDGSVTKMGPGSTGPGGWYTVFPQAAVGNLYFIKASVTYSNGVGEMLTTISGTGFNSSPFDTWLSMSEERSWALNNYTASSFALRELTISIATNNDGTGIVATYTNVSFQTYGP